MTSQGEHSPWLQWKVLIERYRTRLWGKIVLFGLWCNALDLTAHLFFDVVKNRMVAGSVLYETPWYALQFVGLVLWLAVYGTQLPAGVKVWRRVSTSLVVKSLLTLVLCIECITILIRREVFPFSHFAMYASVQPSRELPKKTVRTCFFDLNQDPPREFNLMQEGDLLFHRHAYLGPKTAAMLKWNIRNPRFQHYFYELTRARGFDQLHKGRLIMDWETGQLTREIDEVRLNR